ALSKLPLYGAVGIPEVWIWRQHALEIHVLDQAQGTYRRSSASRLLPELDVELRAAHVQMPDQYDAVRAFRRALAGQRMTPRRGSARSMGAPSPARSIRAAGSRRGRRSHVGETAKTFGVAVLVGAARSVPRPAPRQETTPQ
ncbi:MAG: Uma2 family endonuclease, partial [Thiohalocapsa sp.]